MDEKAVSKIIVRLLEEIAKYAGFLTGLGLFEGKIGIAILLYHGSRHCNSLAIERVADALIDDILEESEQISTTGFTNGLSGIAWGMNHLANHGFIELESTFFDEIDSILFTKEVQGNFLSNMQYPLLGLYILSGYTRYGDKDYWNCQANIYCDNIYELTQTSGKEMLFDNHKLYLTPLQYCLREWEKHNFPFLTQNNKVLQLKQRMRGSGGLKGTNTIKNVFAKKFFYEPVIFNEPTVLKEILTISDISTLFFNKLLYKNMPLPDDGLLCNSFSNVLGNKLLQKELFSQLNHRTIGLSHYISGFTWALLQYNQLKESQ